MKKLLIISLAVNGLLIVAIGFLYYLHFKDAKKYSLENLINVTTHITPKDAHIVYINYDSLLMNYDFAKELSQKLQARKDELEAEFAKKSKNFETETQDYQDKVSKGLVTHYRAQEMEAELSKEQETLMKYRDDLSGQLMEEQQVMNNQLYYSIVSYLKEYNKTKGYQYILSNTMAAGPVLLGNDSLNVTREIVEGINGRYVKEKNNKK
jgi:outer membrane protein